ncbi:hypothetical protein Tco_0819829 [Tanacetum coccineum]|uniref:Uncharacterized protein n=1 Tax=Tanacetum coccineum TaxID=301880 RepID=A0ABQ5A7P2_9ASTR
MAALKYKDDHNKIAYLGRERGCEDFTDILPVVRPNAAGSHDLVATIDDREVVVTESLIRTQFQFDDANGIFDMPINDILEGMRVIGYPTDGTLTFLKIHLSPQWRFLVHTIMHCLSPKSGVESVPSCSLPQPLFVCRLDGILLLSIEAAGSAAKLRQPLYLNSPPNGWPYPSPVSPVTDWRPWPYVSVHSPIREHTPEPVSPPTLPAQTFIFEEPLMFGPEPRPAVENPLSLVCVPQPRPDNYLEPEDLDNVISMEDDTTHGGFHEESPVRPDDAPTPTADAAGRAEDPALLTSLSAKLDRCMGQSRSCEGKKTVKRLMRVHVLVVDASAAEGDVDVQDDIDLDGLSRMASTALGHAQPAVPSEDVEEREEGGCSSLSISASAYRRARTEFSTPAFEQFQVTLSAGVLPHTAVPAGPSIAADKGKAPMPDLDILP